MIVMVSRFIKLEEIIAKGNIGSHGTKWKNGFIKDYMTRYNDLFGMKIKTTKSFLVGRVTKEDARYRSMLKFVGIIEIGVAKTSKHTQVGVRWAFVKQFVKRSVIFKSGGRQDI